MKRTDHQDADDVDILSADTLEPVIFNPDVTVRDIETNRVMSFKQFIQNILSNTL